LTGGIQSQLWQKPCKGAKTDPGQGWVKLNFVDVRETINIPKDKIVVNAGAKSNREYEETKGGHRIR